MRVLTIDPYGDALDFSYRAKLAGHHVRHFIRDDPKINHTGLGLVEVVREFQPFVEWSDLIFLADNIKYMDIFDVVRRTKLVVGATKETAAWELDRKVGMQIMQKHGIEIPPYVEFTNYDKAIAHVKQHGGRWVSKPSGDADKSLSYCSKTPADMIYMLERWKKNPKIKSAFILQEFVEGIEMGVGGWFGPHGFNEGWEENFEFKKLMDGDMGVATGEQGTVIRYVTRSKLARKVLEPLSETLARLGYVGSIDVNCIIDERGNPWPLEFTCRPGYPAFNIEQELRQGDPVEWLWHLARGKDAHNILMNTIAIGVVLSIPDYPYSHLTRKEVLGVPIYGLTPLLERHAHFGQVMMGEAPVWEIPSIPTSLFVKEALKNGLEKSLENLTRPTQTLTPRKKLPVTAGDYVLVMSATAETVWEAKQRAYRRLKRLTIPNSPMWRTDIGDRLSRELPKLQSLGYAMGMEFSTSQPP